MAYYDAPGSYRTRPYERSYDPEAVAPYPEYKPPKEDWVDWLAKMAPTIGAAGGSLIGAGVPLAAGLAAAPTTGGVSLAAMFPAMAEGAALGGTLGGAGGTLLSVPMSEWGAQDLNKYQEDYARKLAAMNKREYQGYQDYEKSQIDAAKSAERCRPGEDLAACRARKERTRAAAGILRGIA